MDIATPARRTVVGNKTMSEEDSKHGKLSECLLGLNATTECHNFPRNCSSAGTAGEPWMGTQPLPSSLLPVPLPNCCPQILREGQTRTPAPEGNTPIRSTNGTHPSLVPVFQMVRAGRSNRYHRHLVQIHSFLQRNEKPGKAHVDHAVSINTP